MKNQLKIPFFLISRHLMRGNKWTFFLTVFLMAAAFINLLFVTALFNGIISMSNNQVIDTSSGHISISPADNQNTIENTDKELVKIEGTPRVQAASAQMVVPASLEYKNIKGTWQIFAVDPEMEKEITNVSQKMIEGSYLEPDDTDQIILGRQIAGGDGVEMNAFSLKGAHAGDKVELVFNNQKREFTIKGIFYTKYLIADRFGFISQKAWEELMPESENKATNIIVRLDKTGDESKVADDLRVRGVGGKIYTWEDNANLMKSVTKSFGAINTVLNLVGILIAAITIFIIIYVDVTNKRQQIGILRAIGIGTNHIRAAYLLQTVIYSVLGILLGFAIFVLAIVPYFKAHPLLLPIGDASLLVNYDDVMMKVEFVVLVGILAGLIPATLVTRAKILETIRGK